MTLSNEDRTRIKQLVNQERYSVFVIGATAPERYQIFEEVLADILAPADPEDGRFLIDPDHKIQKPAGWDNSNPTSVRQALRMNADVIALVDPPEASWPGIFTAMEVGTALFLTLPGTNVSETFERYLATVSRSTEMPIEAVRSGAMAGRCLFIESGTAGGTAKVHRAALSAGAWVFSKMEHI